MNRPKDLDTCLPQNLCGRHAAHLYRSMLRAYATSVVDSEAHPFVSAFIDHSTTWADSCADCWTAHEAYTGGKANR